jgi:hypothetical protein
LGSGLLWLLIIVLQMVLLSYLEHCVFYVDRNPVHFSPRFFFLSFFLSFLLFFCFLFFFLVLILVSVLIYLLTWSFST